MKIKFKNREIDFDDVVDVYDVHGPHDREVEILGYDTTNGDEYNAIAMESCGDIVEVYEDTIETTGMNADDFGIIIN